MVSLIVMEILEGALLGLALGYDELGSYLTHDDMGTIPLAMFHVLPKSTIQRLSYDNPFLNRVNRHRCFPTILYQRLLCFGSEVKFSNTGTIIQCSVNVNVTVTYTSVQCQHLHRSTQLNSTQGLFAIDSRK